MEQQAAPLYARSSYATARLLKKYENHKLIMKVTIIAHPNSKKPRLEKDLFGELHVYVHEPALEDRANLAVIEALAEHFNIRKSAITLLSGKKSKHKTFEIPIN